MKKTAKSIVAIIGVIMLLVGCFGAWLVRSSGNTVQIFEVNIPDQSGTYIHATVFKPKTATAENPAPVVVTCNGYADTGEKQDFAAIELSRRGVVVFEMDALSHGLSSTSTYDSSPASTMGEAVGMISLVEFISNAELDYIDLSRLGITGHSMGGIATRVTYEHFGALETSALEAARLPESDGGEEITDAEFEYAESLNVISAAFFQSALPMPDVGAYGNYYRNAGINYTYYDEGNYTTSNGDGDLTDAPEALAFINSMLGEENAIDTVEIGKYYGSVEDNNLRVVYNVKTTHTFEYMTPASATCLIDFFTDCLSLDTDLSSSNLIFIYRFLFSTIGLIGLGLLITSFVYALLRTKFFGTICVRVPEPKAVLKSSSDKAVFWGSWLVIIVITVFCLVPVIRLDAKIFPVVAGMGYAKVYTSTNVNSFAIWCVFIALVSLVLFLINYNVRLKKQGWSIDDLGLKIGGKNILKSLLLAACVYTIFYVIVFAANFIFHFDFRIWNMSAKVFIADKLVMFIEYLPWFMFFMVIQSLVTNTSNRIAGQKHNLLINVIGNTLGLLIIGVFAYTYLFTTGVSFPAWASAWDRVAQVFPFMLYTLATIIISRRCFEKTGSIWTGAFVNSFIVTMMLVTNTSNFYLLG